MKDNGQYSVQIYYNLTHILHSKISNLKSLKIVVSFLVIVQKLWRLLVRIHMIFASSPVQCATGNRFKMAFKKEKCVLNW